MTTLKVKSNTDSRVYTVSHSFRGQSGMIAFKGLLLIILLQASSLNMDSDFKIYIC